MGRYLPLCCGDIKLLTPSVQTLRIMLAICLNFASKFYIKLNDKKKNNLLFSDQKWTILYVQRYISYHLMRLPLNSNNNIVKMITVCEGPILLWIKMINIGLTNMICMTANLVGIYISSIFL